MPKIKDKERTTILNALRAGVVPSIGLKHIQVGRVQEVAEVVRNLTHMEAGGSVVRFVVGDFGTGKSFFLTLCKLMAHEKKMVVLQADITTEKILCSADGKARSLLTELINNMSCRSKPEGNALRFVIESWISSFLESFPNAEPNDFQKALAPLSHLTLSQDFGNVLYLYLNAYRTQDSVKLAQCLKWFRGEYGTKTEAREDLGVRRIIEDSDFYEMLKLYGGFARLAGYAGLLINVDELAVLVRQRAPIRQKNYETLLTIINDSLQGTVEGIGFYFGATSEVIENKEKGLYSYGALETRLAENRFTTAGSRDLSGPVLRLVTLSPEELFVLLAKLRDIHVNEVPGVPSIDDEGLKSFLALTMERMGAETFINPRDVIKDYLGLLSLLEVNPGKSWKDFLSSKPNPTDPGSPSGTGLVRLKVG